MPSLMLRLKLETADQHAQLERVLDLLNPALSLADYRRLLIRFYGYYVPWERACCTALEPVMPGFFPPRSKLPLLKQDLVVLGLSDSCLAAVPICPQIPAIADFAAALGTMYVMEGSTLGGRVLSRHFATSLGVTPESGASYFAGYGDRTAGMWRDFAATIEGFAASASEKRFTLPACETFVTLKKWLYLFRNAE